MVWRKRRNWRCPHLPQSHRKHLHPCLRPSDTVGYRIALAKYLEGLRNAIVHTKHAHLADHKGKQPASSAEDEAVAWWWKDVVVRKSILEECSGERCGSQSLLLLSGSAR